MKSITNLINPQILRKTSQLAQLDSLVKSCLPTECQKHISAASIRDHQLILISDSPVWSTQLRLYQNNILEMLKSHGNIHISQIIIKQTYHKLTSTPIVYTRRYLSTDSARLLKQTAETINDAELQKALYNLVEKTTKKTQDT